MIPGQLGGSIINTGRILGWRMIAMVDLLISVLGSVRYFHKGYTTLIGIIILRLYSAISVKDMPKYSTR